MAENPLGLKIEDASAMKLVTELLAGNIVDIRPQLDFNSELGYSYPSVEKALDIKGEAVAAVLRYLTDYGVLKKEHFDRLLRCPMCHSLNLTPSVHCPKCGSGNIARGAILQHLVCKYIGIEEEFLVKGKYICPRCQAEMKTVGVDYQSMGLLRKCRNCQEIFNVPLIKWRCLKCGAITPEDKIAETVIYSYRLDEAKRSWLEFELKPKQQLIQFLKQHGYQVTENAEMKGRSGAVHNIDILASRDDGIITHQVAIGVKVAGAKIGLHEIFDFDDKAYDIGIHNKILTVLPELGNEAAEFASLQRIKVVEVKDLETLLVSGLPSPVAGADKPPFEFKSKSQLIEYLQSGGYEVKENARLQGRSGATHNIDILASRDDGIVTHHIAIGMGIGTKPVSLDRVFDFDDKAYDIGILDKVFVAVPGLTREARQFAQRQRIKVFEAKEVNEPVIRD